MDEAKRIIPEEFNKSRISSIADRVAAVKYKWWKKNYSYWRSILVICIPAGATKNLQSVEGPIDAENTVRIAGSTFCLGDKESFFLVSAFVRFLGQISG